MGKTTPPAFASIRILVVDDFEPARSSICSILGAQKRFQVVAEVVDGLEAVQKAQELQPDVILLDIGLPHLNGIKAASGITQVAPSAKIIFVTQHKDVDLVRTALSTGARGYVLKGDVGRDLLPAIEAVIRGEQFVSSGLKGEGPGLSLVS